MRWLPVGLLLAGIFEMKKMILETRWLSLEHPQGNEKGNPLNIPLISFWEFEFHHSFGFHRTIDGLGIANF